eukprot:1144764-Pelagomonas_calceolata.AAC.1
MALKGPALRMKALSSISSKSQEVQAGIQQQDVLELRLQKPMPQKSGRAMGPVTPPAPAPKRQVDRPSASTHE